ncbi:response regulator transcription factor [Streptomyces sp. WMMB 322]|uniref:helix-turn-helix transcriptional regulator n=1 Tax=Streptomyces sp. WMMB 322 TaxID=1286821 RepID=UPI0006E360AF|nr:response regulator transcription factor [Streptomyces sp. WMMB 322]SCK55925.1 DNA-binding response regulator, NarL/FixJ family, contains REC and HTH domains [Streptomyces sp. WMMB 322]
MPDTGKQSYTHTTSRPARPRLRTAGLHPHDETVERSALDRGGLRVFVVHPHQMVRCGLETMMSELALVEHVRVFADVETARRRLGLAHPDVLICRGSATDDVRDLALSCQEQGTKLLSLLEGPEEQQLALASEVPADGFLLAADLTVESLGESLTRLTSGEMPLPASLSRWLLGQLREGAPHRAERSYSLTPRESETLHLLSKGLSNKQIARSLHISQHGAKRHVANVIAKLNCPNRTLAVALALREGLIEDSDDEGI